MNDNHYRESKEDWQKRIFRERDRQQYKEDHTDDERDNQLPPEPLAE